MQNAWRFVTDEALRERLKEAKGIGTPSTRGEIIRAVNRRPKKDPLLECAPAGGQIGRFELTPLAGLPEDGSHDETPVPQRRVQAAGR